MLRCFLWNSHAIFGFLGWQQFPFSRQYDGFSDGSQSAAPVSKVAGCFPCEQCGKVYRYKSNLAKHLRFECGKEPMFACPYCPHKAKAKWNLGKHILTRHPLPEHTLNSSFELRGRPTETNMDDQVGYPIKGSGIPHGK